MSGKGNCYDNAVAESFFHTLKSEHVYGYYYETHEEAKRSIFWYIESYYNRIRRHSGIDYMSPNDFEKKALKMLNLLSVIPKAHQPQVIRKKRINNTR